MFLISTNVHSNSIMKSYHFHWERRFLPQVPFDFSLQEFNEATSYKRMDFHSEVHLNLFIEGCLTGNVGGNVFNMQAPYLQITAPWEIHGNNQIEKGMRTLSITVEPDILLKNLLEFREKALTLFLLKPETRHNVLNTPQTRELLRMHMRKLLGIQEDNPKMQRLRIWIAIQDMLAELLNCIPDTLLPETSFKLYQRLANAFELLQSENRKVSLQEAAKICSLSVSRFNHLFREICRMTFTEYEMRNRLNRAAILIRQGCQIKSVSELEGFYDVSHFSKAFQRQFGIPPSKFH